jgi:antitoxin HigA-1
MSKSSTTIDKEEKMAPKNKMRPIHPGEILREDFLTPIGMTPHALAMALRVPASRINDIVLERRGVTLDTALRLARFFGGDAQSWLNLQNAYDLKVAEAELLPKISREVLPRAA